MWHSSHGLSVCVTPVAPGTAPRCTEAEWCNAETEHRHQHTGTGGRAEVTVGSREPSEQHSDAVVLLKYFHSDTKNIYKSLTSSTPWVFILNLMKRRKVNFVKCWFEIWKEKWTFLQVRYGDDVYVWHKIFDCWSRISVAVYQVPLVSDCCTLGGVSAAWC